MKTKIGILGGGQLGKMLIESAEGFDVEFSVLDNDPTAPCSRILTNFHVGDPTCYNDVITFGHRCDIVTIEVENVNVKALKKLESRGVKVFPQPHIIEMIQNKSHQKDFFVENDIPTAEFVKINSKEDIKNYNHLLPGVNKIAVGGYDGKGVQIINSIADIDKAFDSSGILENKINIDKEIAIIVSRNNSGEIKLFPIVEMVLNNDANLVEYLVSPAEVSEVLSNQARQVAEQIVKKLDFVGILAIEMFIDKKGKLLVNEIAPRPHNSGHHTIEGNYTSQYKQLINCLLNLPLGNTEDKAYSLMINLLGENGFEGKMKLDGYHEFMDRPNVHLHLYGKGITKPKRKMGHITITSRDKQSLLELGSKIRNSVKVISI